MVVNRYKIELADGRTIRTWAPSVERARRDAEKFNGVKVLTVQMIERGRWG